MKHTVYIILFVCLCAPLLAQEGKKIFLDANFETLKNKKGAVYYETHNGIGKKRNFLGKITTYALDGKLLQYAFMKKGKKEGSYLTFNQDGLTSVKGQYIAGAKAGSWFTIDPNGDYIEEIAYNMSGGELERKNLKVDNEVYFAKPDIPATYGKGNTAWSLYIRKSLRYPIELKRAGITGKIEIHFRINKNGEFMGYHVLESPHPILTESIVSLVLNGGKWQGAIKNNQLVNSIFIYKSTYNINDLRKR